jgi:hypothetical protein
VKTTRVRRFPEEQDMILILAVLALCFFVLRQRGWQGERNPVLAPVGSSTAMDGLWRDSVRPLKDGEDMRPQADPEIVWDERRLGARPAPAAPPATPRDAVAKTEPPASSYEFPEPRQVVERPAPRPRLSPQRVSFADRESAQRTKAFLKKPEDEKRLRRKR